tara:strand:+ start:1257 stop:1508 length:252 start_codon:yes stop_codon:yes gene_type:complete
MIIKFRKAMSKIFLALLIVPYLLFLAMLTVLIFAFWMLLKVFAFLGIIDALIVLLNATREAIKKRQFRDGLSQEDLDVLLGKK